MDSSREAIWLLFTVSESDKESTWPLREVICESFWLSESFKLLMSLLREAIWLLFETTLFWSDVICVSLTCIESDKDSTWSLSEEISSVFSESWMSCVSMICSRVSSSVCFVDNTVSKEIIWLDLSFNETSKLSFVSCSSIIVSWFVDESIRLNWSGEESTSCLPASFSASNSFCRNP